LPGPFALGVFRLKKAGKPSDFLISRMKINPAEFARQVFNPLLGDKMGYKLGKQISAFPRLLHSIRNWKATHWQDFLIFRKFTRPFLSIEEQNEWMGSIVLTPHLRLFGEFINQVSPSLTLWIVFGGSDAEDSVGFKIPNS